MPLPQDFREFIELLNAHKVRYVMVGGWAYNLYAPPRMTGDIDFFIASDSANEECLRQALEDFGFGALLPPTNQKWLHKEKIIMLGREPCRIDILCHIDGVTFDEVWESRETVDFGGIAAPAISLNLLMRNKAASGRDKDQLDLKVLQKLTKRSG